MAPYEIDKQGGGSDTLGRKVEIAGEDLWKIGRKRTALLRWLTSLLVLSTIGADRSIGGEP